MGECYGAIYELSPTEEFNLENPLWRALSWRAIINNSFRLFTSRSHRRFIRVSSSSGKFRSESSIDSNKSLNSFFPVNAPSSLHAPQQIAVELLRSSHPRRRLAKPRRLLFSFATQKSHHNWNPHTQNDERDKFSSGKQIFHSMNFINGNEVFFIEPSKHFEDDLLSNRLPTSWNCILDIFCFSSRRVFFFLEDFRFLTCKKMSWNINAEMRDLHLHEKSENCSGWERIGATREKRLIDILLRPDPHENENLYWIKRLLWI